MRRPVTVFVLALAALAWARPAEAIPYFAHEYGLVCQKCHSAVPHLTAFGRAFLDHGYQLPGAHAQRVAPLAAKINLAYTSEPDPSGLPKATLDEVELFLANRIGSRANYFVEQYVVDGGRHGATRDAWLQLRLTPDAARVPVAVQAGAFTLPLPVDPESFRETAQHYTLFDQVVGANPFNFFDAKIGLQLRAGDLGRGTSVTLAALEGHDKQSGLPASGTDTMLAAQHALGPVTLSLYRYDGTRPIGDARDRFRRQGYGLAYAAGRWESQTVLGDGYDALVATAGGGARSSGGFTQLRYAFNPRLFGLARYEGTNDPTAGFTRDLVTLAGFRLTRNSRLTIEDVVRTAPRTTHTLDAQYTVAY